MACIARLLSRRDRRGNHPGCRFVCGKIQRRGVRESSLRAAKAMIRSVTVCADDFGLSRGITDSILQTVDEGPVTQVSVIPNGEAVEYALAEYRRRSDRLALAVHVNLTEGKPLSS